MRVLQYVYFSLLRGADINVRSADRTPLYLPYNVRIKGKSSESGTYIRRKTQKLRFEPADIQNRALALRRIASRTDGNLRLPSGLLYDKLPAVIGAQCRAEIAALISEKSRHILRPPARRYEQSKKQHQKQRYRFFQMSHLSSHSTLILMRKIFMIFSLEKSFRI